MDKRTGDSESHLPQKRGRFEDPGTPHRLETPSSSFPKWRYVGNYDLDGTGVTRSFAAPPLISSLLGQINAKQVSYNGWIPNPVCLPSVYLTSSQVTRSPRPPPYLDTASNQMLAVGMGLRVPFVDQSVLHLEYQLRRDEVPSVVK